jgi:hypothetical protein
MRLPILCSFALALTGTCFAQQWELGAAGGIGVYNNATVTNNGATADAGFKTGPTVGAFATQNLYTHLSGEFRYMFQFSDLKVSSGSSQASFAGQSHAVHYDLLFMGSDREARVRPYLAGGGGVKLYRGTGAQHADQDLLQFVALTHTQQIEPLVTFGGGVRCKAGRRSFFYLEARDYLTPFPKNVVAPVPPSKLSGWLHDFVPMAGFSFGF